jgi:carboxymethylenebutenolidase
MGTTVSVDSAGSKMNIYAAPPKGTAKGAVIVIQEAFGITDHIKDVANRLADEGYLAVAPHLFHRSGDPIIAYDKMQEVMPHIMQLKAETLKADVDATLAYLKGQGFSEKQIGVVGFCMGGTIAFFAAGWYGLGAVVTFYGGGITQGRFGMPAFIELAPKLKTPWLGLYGDCDQGIPLTEVEMLRKAVTGGPVPAEVVRYPDAEHGFHCNHRPSFHEGSSKDGWQRAVKWFNTHMQAR